MELSKWRLCLKVNSDLTSYCSFPLLRPLALYPLPCCFLKCTRSLGSFAFVLPSLCNPVSPDMCLDCSCTSLKSQLRGHLFSKALAIFFKTAQLLPLPTPISLPCSLRNAVLSIVAIWNSAFRWVYLSFSPSPFTSLLFSAICKASSDDCCLFAFLCLRDGFDHYLLYNVMNFIHSSSSNLSDVIP